MSQRNLFDVAQTQRPAPAGWTPDEPPHLNGERVIRLDAETNSLEWWKPTTRPVGWAYWLPESGRRGYLPFGHKGGGNLDEARVKDWARTELRNVHIDNVNTKYDGHISREWGIDLAAQGCTFGDVAHRAALLDDHRFRFNLNQLAEDILGIDAAKVDLGLSDKGTLWELPAWEVAPYAVRDVELVDMLVKATQPMIEDQELEDVLALEEAIIPVVMEMERNGTYLNVELLHQWQAEAKKEFEEIMWSIFRETGVRMTSPDSSKDLVKLFDACDVPITTFTDAGKPSFTDDVLSAIDHPAIKKVRYAGQLADLRSKYLDKYAATVRSDGWLRFNLHQLRVGRDENDKKGTVSGRFSSAGDEYGGFNVQQVVSADKQTSREWCTKYLVKNLFIPRPGSGMQWLSADAKQIEYRIFAHYANSEQILSKYREDPEVDYHNLVQPLLQRARPTIGRKETKITNFCKLFGAALIKFAWTLKSINDREFKELSAKYDITKWKKTPRGARERAMREEPALQEARGIMDAYDEMIPEAKEMLDLAKNTAKERGWVKTMQGRRARFGKKHGREHSALNRIVQGTAADINKLMLVDAYRERKNLGLELITTVHDELDAGIQDASPESVSRVEEFLNEQRVPLRVPILWDVGVGPTWATAKGKA
jgi:DNA polymerase-1